MKMEQTEYSETSPYKIQTPGNYPEESIKYSEHDESLKSRMNSPSFMKIQIINPYLFKIHFNIIFLFSTPNFLRWSLLLNIFH